MVKNPHPFHNGAWQSRFVPQSRLILERVYCSAMTRFWHMQWQELVWMFEVAGTENWPFRSSVILNSPPSPFELEREVRL
jgi:hypothetical protein